MNRVERISIRYVCYLVTLNSDCGDILSLQKLDIEYTEYILQYSTIYMFTPNCGLNFLIFMTLCSQYFYHIRTSIYLTFQTFPQHSVVSYTIISINKKSNAVSYSHIFCCSMAQRVCTSMTTKSLTSSKNGCIMASLAVRRFS